MAREFIKLLICALIGAAFGYYVKSEFLKCYQQKNEWKQIAGKDIRKK